MRTPSKDWENLLLGTGSPDKVLLIAFKNPKLKPLTGKTLGEVARMRGKSPEETAMDLVIEDGSRVGTVYFLMNEDNVKRQVGLPWMSFGSDAESQRAGRRIPQVEHPPARLRQFRPRARHLLTRPERSAAAGRHPPPDLLPRNQPRYQGPRRRFATAIMPTSSCSTRPRSRTIRRSKSRMQLSTGVRDVFVNGTQVLKGGEHTGAKPGRFVRGPGWTGWADGGACK